MTSETTDKASGGGKITLLIVAGIIIVGAAAFTYHYCKKRMTPADPAPADRELVEITVNKKVDPTEEQATIPEQKPLLQNNRNNTNSVETQEIRDDERPEDKEQSKELQNGNKRQEQ